MDQDLTTKTKEWTRGYYGAVAALLRETGTAEGVVTTLFQAGRDPFLAEKADRQLFIEHGLMKNLPWVIYDPYAGEHDDIIIGRFETKKAGEAKLRAYRKENEDSVAGCEVVRLDSLHLDED